MKFTVEAGKRYAARVSLSGLETFATNEQIVEKLTFVGFKDVNCEGEGGSRIARGTWLGENRSEELPEQITEIKEIPIPDEYA